MHSIPYQSPEHFLRSLRAFVVMTLLAGTIAHSRAAIALEPEASRLLQETVIHQNLQRDFKAFALTEARLSLYKRSPSISRAEVDFEINQLRTRLVEVETLVTTGNPPSNDLQLQESFQEIGKILGLESIRRIAEASVATTGGLAKAFASFALDEGVRIITAPAAGEAIAGGQRTIDNTVYRSDVFSRRVSEELAERCSRPGVDCADFEQDLGHNPSSSDEELLQRVSPALAVFITDWSEIKKQLEEGRIDAAGANQRLRQIEEGFPGAFAELRAEFGDDIDSILAQISNLANVTEENVEGLREQLQVLAEQTGRNTQTLSEIVGIVKEQARAKRIEDARQKQARRAEYIATAQAIAKFARLIGASPDIIKFTDDAATVVTATIQINALYDKIADANFDFTSFATIGATFQIANIALTLFDSFSGGGESADEAILDALADLRRQVEELRAEINERFDRVDSRLNQLLIIVVDGFDRVLNNQDVIIEAVRQNTAIALSTQALILQENERIVQEIRDNFLQPCVQRRVISPLPLDDQRFVDCAVSLGTYASDTLIRENALNQYSASWTTDTFITRLEETESQQRHATLLLGSVADFTNNAALLGFGTVLNFGSWAQYSKWYADFLIEDVAQTRALIFDQALAMRFDEISSAGRNLIEFRRELLRQLSVEGADEPTTVLGRYLEINRSFDFEGLGTEIASSLFDYRDVEAAGFPPAGADPDAAPRYLTAPGFPAELGDANAAPPLYLSWDELDRLARWNYSLSIQNPNNNYFASYGPASQDSSSVQLANDVLMLPYLLTDPSSGSRLSGLGSTIRAAVEFGLGNLRFDTRPVIDGTDCALHRYVGDDLYSEGCNVTVNVFLAGRYGDQGALWDGEDLLLFSFETVVDNGLLAFVCDGECAADRGFDPVANPALVRPLPGAYTGSAFIAVYNKNLISAAVRAAWVQNNTPLPNPGVALLLEAVWEEHRAEWAQRLSDVLIDPIGPWANYDDAAKRANTVISAVLRFVLGDLANDTDSLYAFALGRVGVPEVNQALALLGGDASSVAVIGNYMRAESEALEQYLLSDRFQSFVQLALASRPWERYLERVELVPTILRAVVEVDSRVDSDGDGYANEIDAFFDDENEWLDTDGDGFGNNADRDDDNDGIEDALDSFPLLATEWRDTDNDGVGNEADSDDDGDGLADVIEIAAKLDPLNPDDAGEDLDGDGLTNAEELKIGTNIARADSDDDGVGDGVDNCPNIFNAGQSNFDGDSSGDECDDDDDNDGLTDAAEIAAKLDPLNPNDADEDRDDDGLTNAEEVGLGTNFSRKDSDADGINDGDEQAVGRDPSVNEDLEPRAMAVLGDINGDNRSDIGVLLTDQLSGRNFVHVMDSGGRGVLYSVPFGLEIATGYVRVPDMTGDQIEEPAVLLGGDTFALVKDPMNSLLLGRPTFANDFAPFAFLSVDDADGQNGPDIAAVALEVASGRVRAQVKNVTDGSLVARFNYDSRYMPIGAAVVENAGGTAANEIAVLGIDDVGRIRAQVKDALNGELINLVYFDRRFTPLAFAALPDPDGELRYLAVLGRDEGGVIRVQIKRVSDASLVANIRFESGFEPKALISFGDSNVSFGGEVGVVGVDAEGRVRLQIKEIEDGTPVGVIWFASNHEPIDAIAVNGAAGTGRNEIAVLLADESGQFVLQVKDLVTGDAVLNTAVP